MSVTPVYGGPVCGRYVSSSSAERIAEHFGATIGAELADGGLPASYNVAPTNDVFGLVEGPDGIPVLRVFHWGLVPVWAKDEKIGSKMINARAETLATKSVFKPLLAKRRCIVPMDGFYEWKPGQPGGPLTKAGKPVKQPVYIHSISGEPLAVAGLWTAWRDKQAPAGENQPWLHSCTIITTDANATMAPVHDRMPAILPESRWQEWLDADEHDLSTLQSMLTPAADDLLTLHLVGLAVNNVRSSGPELILPT